MGVTGVMELNEALPYLPCLKHKEGSPTAMSAMNTKYVEFKLCTIVFNAVNLTTLATFYAAV